MWRRTRTPDGVRIELDGVELGGAAPAGAPTDAELIACLRCGLAARDATIRQLRDQFTEVADGLEQRHPAAGRRFDDDPDQDETTRLRKDLADAQAHCAELSQRLAHAHARLDDYQAADGNRSCARCAGHRRVIAELEAARREDRRLLARLTLGAS